MSQNEGNKPKQQKPKKELLVRFGKMGLLGWFEHHETEIPQTKTRVVIKTQRGLELGEVVGPHCYQRGHFRLNCKQVEDYYPNKTKDYPLTDGGTFVRYATEEDLMEEKHLEGSAKEEAKTCQKFINEMKLPMKVVEAEHLFGGERIIIYFSSNGRVDFRELVRLLAKEYQTRIELRQIGSRDEARLISDLESCGQECCCKRFLKILDPVNMRMAKLQKATLDPSKISGHCGRLKCCLRYEDETYKDLKYKLPKKNSWVETPKGIAKVIDTQILTQLVVVQDSKNNREAFGLESVTPTNPPSMDQQKQEQNQVKKEEIPAEEIPDLTEPIEPIKVPDEADADGEFQEAISIDEEIDSLSNDLKAEVESNTTEEETSDDNPNEASAEEISKPEQTDKGKHPSRHPRKNRRNRRKNRQNKKPQQDGSGNSDQNKQSDQDKQNNQDSNKPNNNRNKNRRKNRRFNKNKPGDGPKKDNSGNNNISDKKDNQ